MPVNQQALDIAGGGTASAPSTMKSAAALHTTPTSTSSFSSFNNNTTTTTKPRTTTRVTTTVRISGPRALIRRRSSRSGTSVFSTKNLTAAVKMVATKASTAEAGPLPLPSAPPKPSVSPAPSSAPSSSPAPPTIPIIGTNHHKTHSQHRISKPTGPIGSRKVFAKINSMDPPVRSFYGAEPIPLPSRFASIKRRLIQGREAEIEASFKRLLTALAEEIAHIQSRGASLVPTIDFASLDDPAAVAPFERDLKRYGVALVRGVVSQTQTETWISQTRAYLTRNRDHIRPTIPQDPTCFELFWTPAQCAIRAHPAVLRVQRWAMGFWETKGSEKADISRVATRFPIAYADRLRIHDGSIMGPAVTTAVSTTTSNPTTTSTPTSSAPPTPLLNGNSAADSLTASAASTLIAQVDNGSLERWEPDGYGRGGAYDAIFRGEWEDFDPWDPSGRITVTQDLYNGAGACSIFRMFQGILALTSGEPASIRVLPSPKLVVAYLLLRPFFSPKTPPPPTASPDEEGGASEAEWDAYLHPDNWALDAEQSTIIHGAVPGHAQRITELWHPHLRLRRSLVEIPTLSAGDYVLWHCDQAYSIMTASTTNNVSSEAPSMLMYTPACPLTQTNALFLARQRKAFLLGQPGPDFDSTGSAAGSEAPHEGRPGKEEIAAVGGDAGLRAMGLAPWELSRDGNAVMTRPGTRAGTPSPSSSSLEKDDGNKMDIDNNDGGEGAGRKVGTEGEAEVVRLANIILFPDRYDFYIPTEKPQPAEKRMNGKAQAEQMAATRQLISRILS